MMGAPGATPPAVPVKLADQVAAVIREIGMRKHVYPGWVAKGKMKQEKADHELAAMEAALVSLRDYQAMQPKVLALTAVSLTLAKGLRMSQEAFDELLVKAEADAVHQLGQVEKPVETLLVDAGTAPAWPFRRERMP